MTNVVYIIGNGFDLRMGIPTDYPNFLKYYKTSEVPSPEIGDIKMKFFQRMKEEETKKRTNGQI